MYSVDKNKTKENKITILEPLLLEIVKIWHHENMVNVEIYLVIQFGASLSEPQMRNRNWVCERSEYDYDSMKCSISLPLGSNETAQ